MNIFETASSCFSWWRYQIEIFSAVLALCDVNSSHKDQWHGALMLSLICAWTKSWVNNRYACDLRRHRAHCDVISMHFCIDAPETFRSIVLYCKLEPSQDEKPKTFSCGWNFMYVSGPLVSDPVNYLPYTKKRHSDLHRIHKHYEARERLSVRGMLH